MDLFLCFLLCFAYCLAPGESAADDYTSDLDSNAKSQLPKISSPGVMTKNVPLLNEDGELPKTTSVTGTADSHSFWSLVTGNQTDEETSSAKIISSTLTELTSYGTSQNDYTELTISSDDGSGDMDTEITHEISTPETPTVIPQPCFFTPCNSSHLRIQAKTVILAPEGTNITIPCKVENHEIEVHWYKMNGSNVQFKTSARNQSILNLTFSKLKVHDSGLYSCAQKNESSCCRAEVRLKVYVVPNYKRHLMIIGTVALVCFLVCASFSVWWNKKKLGQYAKQYKSANKLKKTDLLLA